MTWIQLANVTMNNLNEETQKRLIELAEERPADFVAITNGDESLVREINLDSILTPERLLDSIEDGDIHYARVVVSNDLYGHDFFLENAQEIRNGYHADEKVCILEYPLQ